MSAIITGIRMSMKFATNAHGKDSSCASSASTTGIQTTMKFAGNANKKLSTNVPVAASAKTKPSNSATHATKAIEDLRMLCQIVVRNGGLTWRQKRIMRWTRLDLPLRRRVALLRQFVRMSALEKPAKTTEWGVMPDERKEFYRQRAIQRNK